MYVRLCLWVCLICVCKAVFVCACVCVCVCVCVAQCLCEGCVCIPLMCILGICPPYVHFRNVSIECVKQENYKKQNLEQGRSYIKLCHKYNSYL